MRQLVITLAASTLLLPGASAQSPRAIENPRPTWKPGEALVLSAAPTLVIGADGGPDYELSRVRGAARLTDGRIVVADGGSLTLRFYDATGRYLKSAGGKGEGPGEFERMDSFWRLPGDTLVAGGMARGDLSYFSGDGKYLVRLTRTPPPSRTTARMQLTLLPLDGAGTRVTATLGGQADDAGRLVDSFAVAITDSRNADLHRVGSLPYMATVVYESRPPRFSPMAVFAGDGKRFYFGFSADYSIRVYTDRGELSHLIRRAWTPTKVTKADIEAYAIAWAKDNIKSSGAEAAAERAAIRKEPYASTFPAFSQFLVDASRRLWVRAPKLAEAGGPGQFNGTPPIPSTWSVFDPAGRWLGDVTMPARFLPRDIGPDYVLGTALDADNVETVVLYRLAPRGAR